MRVPLVTLIVLIAPFAATAQISTSPSDELARKWKPEGILGVNLSFASSQDVVGQTSGVSQTYGLSVRTSLTRKGDRNEWRNTLTLDGQTTKTPNVPRFVKANDELKLGSIYLHSLGSLPDRFGVYARGEAAAPIFKGEDVRSEDKTYVVEQTGATLTASTFRLTDGFKPLTTKEAAGMFYRPIKEEKIQIETRAGLAGLQVAASGQYAVKGVNSATGQIDITRLSDVNQAGVELALSIKGKANENSTYELGAESMTPFVSNNQRDLDDRGPIRLTNVDAFFKVSSKITSWASFGYDYKLKIQPQVVDRAQQIHMAVINVTHNMF